LKSGGSGGRVVNRTSWWSTVTGCLIGQRVGLM
jgi:hypothetical protein